ncbi:hypothetical protein CW826_02615 [Listeria monocytogenes]|uniref:hypothetical protein n=1 Tax=Listeria monocytogenes TaxID=1639 RepID=UPI0010D7B561|nr:hypothetical protein [Listeria monocytogenes]EAH4128696.1 hypothetical protein [Listeria monocytogenes LIS0077]EAE5752936.1 hypothetical protein [Listeria monocytogenes]EAE6636424.1 hypothetical protein [Listeria monocytogenes]EAE7699046.1 hypothetical protein [Listeria monocytogenes]EAE8353867.1 hypothetical protein [Listeria monocytogenes]
MIDDALDLISRRLANNDDFKSLSETQRHTIRTKLNINDSTSIILGTEKNDFLVGVEFTLEMLDILNDKCKSKKNNH